MSTDKLLKIKNQIDEARTKQSEIKGQISGVERELEINFKVNNIKDAEIKLNKLEKELDEQENNFNTKMEELENAYEWNI